MTLSPAPTIKRHRVVSVPKPPVPAPVLHSVILSVLREDGRTSDWRTMLLCQPEQIEVAARSYVSQLYPDYRRFTVVDAVPAEAPRGGTTSEAEAGASCPPTNNMGGTGHDPAPGDAAGISEDGLEAVKIYAKGSGRYVMVRIPGEKGDVQRRAAFVDQISFTFHRSKLRALPDGLLLPKLSDILRYVFGFGITSDRDKGLNFYEKTSFLGDGHGLVCYGGQRDTILVQLYGSGCYAAKAGWQVRLYRMLRRLEARITRVDLAADVFDGSYTPDTAEQDWVDGQFSLTNRQPSIERRGNWHAPDGKGRTLYIGKRESGKLLRVYEKGKQLGGGFLEERPDLDKWTRVELELHNVDRTIPLEVILRPGRFLAGAYPALSWVEKVQRYIVTKKKIVQTTVERSMAVLKHQFGKYLWTFSELLGSEGENIPEWLKKLFREEVPERLNLGDYRSVPLVETMLEIPI